MKPVFISYATSDRAEALKLCDAIERRGVRCWIAARDVEPGENYQEAIVRAIRTARALVLVFSDRANNSDEIKKELSLVSRFRIPLIALRVEDVEPSDAFAYELSTRQWIDLFEDWDKSIDALIKRVGSIEPGESAASDAAPAPEPTRRAAPPPAPPRKPWHQEFRSLGVGLAAILLLIAIGAGWYWFRPAPPAEHPMEVRLATFQKASGAVPDTLPQAMRDEIISAFSHDGLIGISTARDPRPGTAPAYALSESAGREGDTIRIIVTLTNERTGATLWSNTYTYPAKQIDRVAHIAALDVSDAVRTALFAASTYPKALPDEVLALYFQGLTTDSPTKSLDLARKLVAMAPDFSWGWSAVGLSASGVVFEPGTHPEDISGLREEGIRAFDKAIAIDPTNSEALTAKADLIPADDLMGREALYKRALTARPLVCGCEHHEYGMFLIEVGRIQDAIRELRRSIDVMPLNPSTQIVLGRLLFRSGDTVAARQAFDAYVDLTRKPAPRSNLALVSSPATQDWAAALHALDDPDLALPSPAVKAAWSAALRALVAKNAAARTAAAPALVQVAETAEVGTGYLLSIPLLGSLGAYPQAFATILGSGKPDDVFRRYLLFAPGMEGAVHDPGFPALAEKMGLTRYWRQAGVKPDFCQAKDAPAYCRDVLGQAAAPR